MFARKEPPHIRHEQTRGRAKPHGPNEYPKIKARPVTICDEPNKRQPTLGKCHPHRAKQYTACATNLVNQRPHGTSPINVPPNGTNLQSPCRRLIFPNCHYAHFHALKWPLCPSRVRKNRRTQAAGTPSCAEAARKSTHTTLMIALHMYVSTSMFAYHQTREMPSEAQMATIVSRQRPQGRKR